MVGNNGFVLIPSASFRIGPDDREACRELNIFGMAETAGSNFDWPLVLEQNRSWLTKVLRARIGDPHDVDDVYQEIVVAVRKQAQRSARSAQQGSQGSSIERSPTVPTEKEKIAPWLYRLAIRHVVNFYRRTNRRSHAKPTADLEPFSEQPQPLDWMLAVEQQEQLQTALDQLRPQDREILMFKYELNWSYKQMAEHLGVPVRNIEYRLLNARKRLRSSLKVMSTNQATVYPRD